MEMKLVGKGSVKALDSELAMALEYQFSFCHLFIDHLQIPDNSPYKQVIQTYQANPLKSPIPVSKTEAYCHGVGMGGLLLAQKTVILTLATRSEIPSR